MLWHAEGSAVLFFPLWKGCLQNNLFSPTQKNVKTFYTNQNTMLFKLAKLLLESSQQF